MLDELHFDLDEELSEVSCHENHMSNRTKAERPLFTLGLALVSACLYIAKENEAAREFRKEYRRKALRELAAGGWSKRNMPAHMRVFKTNNRQLVMWEAARRRAKAHNLPFDIEPEDIIIPTHCPLLGVELKHSYGRSGGDPASMTLDRYQADRGYVKGNVVVISNKANMSKNSLSFKEINTLASNMLLLERAYRNKTLK